MEEISKGFDYIYKNDIYGLRFLNCLDEMYIPQTLYDTKSPFDHFVDCMLDEPANVLFQEPEDLIIKRHLNSLPTEYESHSQLVVERLSDTVICGCLLLQHRWSRFAQWTKEIWQEMNTPNMLALNALSDVALVKRAKESDPESFLEKRAMAEVFSVGVFKPYRGQGVARFMYQGLDHILKEGLPVSDKDKLNFTVMHIGCSAPETMHLCEKFGYQKISEVIYSQEMDTVLSFGELSVAMPGFGSKVVAEKFRGGEPRLEYWVKQAFFEEMEAEDQN